MALANSFKIPSRNEADARVWNGVVGGEGGGGEVGTQLSRPTVVATLRHSSLQQIQNVEGPRRAQGEKNPF